MLKPKLKTIKPLFRTMHLNLYALDYQIGNKSKTYNLASTNPYLNKDNIGQSKEGVTLIVFNQKHTRLLLCKEYRLGVNQYVINSVAGYIDKNESIIDAAKRELKEETGLELTSVLKVLPFAYTCPSISDISASLVICEAKGIPKPSDNPVEQITAAWLSKENIRNLLNMNNIKFSVQAQAIAYLWAYEN